MLPNDSLFIDSVLRLQACTSLSQKHWLEVVGLTRKEYQAFMNGQKELPLTSLNAVCQYTDVSPEDLIGHSVDFRQVAIRLGKGQKELTEPYSIAAFGRRRTTITSFDYIEEKCGWRTRADLLRAFDLNEAILTDFMAPINMQFMTDVASHLQKKHGMSEQDFFKMGAHSPIANRATLIGQNLRTARSVSEAHETMFDGLIKFFEQNTKYSITRMDHRGCTIDVTSNKFIAEALQVDHLGNEPICHLKAGWLASIPLYMNLPLSDVIEPLCVHRGDRICRYEIDFPR